MGPKRFQGFQEMGPRAAKKWGRQRRTWEIWSMRGMGKTRKPAF